MKKILFFLIIILLLAFSVHGETTYENIGGENKDYSISETMILNDLFDTDDLKVGSRSQTDPEQLPLVSDLDNDGTKEVIILNDNGIKIYNISNSGTQPIFNFKWEYSTSAVDSASIFSNIIIYDIDADLTKEIIFYSLEEDYMYILDWNGDNLTEEGYNSTLPVHTAGSDAIIGCGDSDGCMMIWTGFGFTNATAFDDNQIFNNGCIELFNDARCLPRIKDMPYLGGYYWATHATTNSQTHALYRLVPNASNHVLFDRVIRTDIYQFGSCTAGGTVEISSPIATTKFLEGSGVEVAYAYNSGQEEFNLVAYHSDLTLIKKYPLWFPVEGNIIGNPFMASAFEDSIGTSICALGQDYTDSLTGAEMGELTLVCADEISNHPPKASILCPLCTSSVIWAYDFTDYPSYNLSRISPVYSSLSHSIEARGESFGVGEISEVLTPYGIFDIQDESNGDGILCNLPVGSICSLTPLWRIPSNLKFEIALIPINYFDELYPDILGLSTNSLLYFDDSAVNRNAYFGDLTSVSPKPQNGFKLHIFNSTNQTNKVVISIEAIDPDNDQVSARAILYYGGGINVQDTGYTPSASSGSLLNLESETGIILLPNVTTPDAILRLMVKDVINFNDTPYIQDIRFSVSPSGDFYYESTEYYGDDPEDEGEAEGGECETDDDCGDGLNCNSLYVCVETGTEDAILDFIAPPSIVSDAFRPLFFLLVIVILMASVGVWLQQSNIIDPRIWLGGLGGTFLVSYAFFVTLGGLPAWVLILLIVVGGALIGVRFTPLYDRVKGF